MIESGRGKETCFLLCLICTPANQGMDCYFSKGHQGNMAEVAARSLVQTKSLFVQGSRIFMGTLVPGLRYMSRSQRLSCSGIQEPVGAGAFCVDCCPYLGCFPVVPSDAMHSLYESACLLCLLCQFYLFGCWMYVDVGGFKHFFLLGMMVSNWVIDTKQFPLNVRKYVV